MAPLAPGSQPGRGKTSMPRPGSARRPGEPPRPMRSAEGKREVMRRWARACARTAAPSRPPPPLLRGCELRHRAMAFLAGPHRAPVPGTSSRARTTTSMVRGTEGTARTRTAGRGFRERTDARTCGFGAWSGLATGALRRPERGASGVCALPPKLAAHPRAFKWGPGPGRWPGSPPRRGQCPGSGFRWDPGEEGRFCHSVSDNVDANFLGPAEPHPPPKGNCLAHTEGTEVTEFFSPLCPPCPPCESGSFSGPGCIRSGRGRPGSRGEAPGGGVQRARALRPAHLRSRSAAPPPPTPRAAPR